MITNIKFLVLVLLCGLFLTTTSFAYNVTLIEITDKKGAKDDLEKPEIDSKFLTLKYATKPTIKIASDKKTYIIELCFIKEVQFSPVNDNKDILKTSVILDKGETISANFPEANKKLSGKAVLVKYDII